MENLGVLKRLLMGDPQEVWLNREPMLYKGSSE